MEAELLVPPFILKEEPPKPKEETPKIASIHDDPYGGGLMNTKIPNFTKKVANLHYISEVSGEYGTLHIRPGMREDDIMEQYARLFPKECHFYLEEIKNINQTLYTSTGMSQQKLLMSLTKIPEIIYTAFKFLDEDYWMDKKAFYRFIRRYPKFMIGNHNRKFTNNRSIIR